MKKIHQTMKSKWCKRFSFFIFHFSFNQGIGLGAGAKSPATKIR